MCCTGDRVDDTENMFVLSVNWMSIKAKLFAFNFHVLNNDVFPIKIISVACTSNWVFSFHF
jgi:hypothetical protein